MYECSVISQNIRKIKTDTTPFLICFSHLRWDFVFQRPQHLLTRAARSYRVVVMEEPVTGDVGEAMLSLSRRPGGITVATPVMPHGVTADQAIVIQRQLLDEFLSDEKNRPRIAWFYSPAAIAFAGHVKADVTVYDCMDELANFKGASARLKQQERQLLAKADLVFTGGQSLYEAKKGLHPHMFAFPSSIDRKHFAKARSHEVSEPDDLTSVPHPRIGFFGVIDERMDTALVGQIAAMRPDWHFALVGPVVKIEESELPRAPNLHWLGGKSYKDLPHYLGHWDLGYMPFAINDATTFISPTKTPEFLAAGLPVVSTPIRDVVRPYGEKHLVEIAATAEEAVAALERLFAMPREPWLAAVDAFLATTSWDDTWRQMHRLIQARTADRRAAAWKGIVVSGLVGKEAARV
jgi:glycosyltransferase involved in cell wall biosynthesis